MIKLHHVRELMLIDESLTIVDKFKPGDQVCLRGELGGGYGLVLSTRQLTITVFWSQLPEIFALIPNYESGFFPERIKHIYTEKDQAADREKVIALKF